MGPGIEIVTGNMVASTAGSAPAGTVAIGRR